MQQSPPRETSPYVLARFAGYRLHIGLIVLAIALVHVSVNAAEQDAGLPDAPEPIEVHRAAEPVVIDGKLDEPVWQNAHVTPVKWKSHRGKTTAVDPVAHVKVAWDENYFYIGYETFDSDLQARTEGLPEGPVERPRPPVQIVPGEADLIEFFVVMASDRFFWELHHNASNNFSDIWITVPEKDWPISKTTMTRYGIIFGHGMVLQDDQWCDTTVATAVSLKPGPDGKPSTVNESGDTDAGYFGEMRFPWVSLGTPNDRRTYKLMPPREEGGREWKKPDVWDMAGQTIRMLTVVEQHEADHRYFHGSETFAGGWFHMGVDYYPEYQLVDQTKSDSSSDK